MMGKAGRRQRRRQDKAARLMVPAAGCAPVEGGAYQVSEDFVEVIAIGRYADRLAVVSRMNHSDRLTLWPIEFWLTEYGAGHLVGFDASVSQQIVRGTGHWLGIGCLVAQVQGEIFFAECEVFNETKA